MKLLASAFLNAAEQDHWKDLRRNPALKRADKSTLFLISAIGSALENAGIVSQELPPGTGLLTATAFGPQNTGVKFLNDMLDYPEDQVLPATFSHSVYNAAASYAAAFFALRGPSYSVAGFRNLCESSLKTAEVLLESDFCPLLIYAVISEMAVFSEAASRILRREKPVAGPGSLPAEEEEEEKEIEGAAAFLLAKGQPENEQQIFPPAFYKDFIPVTERRLNTYV